LTAQKGNAGHVLIIRLASLFQLALHRSRPSPLLPHYLQLLWISSTKALPSIAFLRVLPHCHLHHLAADSGAVPNLTLTILAQIVLMPHQSTCQNWNVAVAVAAAQIASVDVVHLVGGAVQIQAFRPSLTQLLVSLQDILMKVIHAVIVATQLMFPLCPSEVAAKAKIRSRSSMARYFFTSLSPICFSFLYYLSLCLLSHLVVLLFVG